MTRPSAGPVKLLPMIVRFRTKICRISLIAGFFLRRQKVAERVIVHPTKVKMSIALAPVALWVGLHFFFFDEGLKNPINVAIKSRISHTETRFWAVKYIWGSSPRSPLPVYMPKGEELSPKSTIHHEMIGFF